MKKICDSLSAKMEGGPQTRGCKMEAGFKEACERTSGVGIIDESVREQVKSMTLSGSCVQ